MTELTEKEKEYIAKDIKFYSPQRNTFCLGSNLEEAAEIMRLIQKNNFSKSAVRRKEDVGMDLSRK
jgi:hypothetical protein